MFVLLLRSRASPIPIMPFAIVVYAFTLVGQPFSKQLHIVEIKPEVRLKINRNVPNRADNFRYKRGGFLYNFLNRVSIQTI